MTGHDHAEGKGLNGDLSHRGKNPLISPSEFRCVWMAAGILSYQLCEREFDCEKCQLDLALRQRFESRETTLAQEPEEPHEGTLYSRKHVWVRSEGEKSVRIGIEPGFASALLSPKAIVLPALGERVMRNKVCSWIVLDGGTLPIVSPLGGKVTATNAHLAENPRAVCLSPLGQGWLFELGVDPGVKEDADQFAVADVARVYGDDERRFQALLSAELMKGGTEVGLTLADGGQALENLSKMLGPTKYFKLVRNVYG